MAGERPQPEMYLDDELFLEELSPSSAFNIPEAAPDSLDQALWRRSIGLENSQDETAAFPSTFLDGMANPFRFVEEAESGNALARMNSAETVSLPVRSFPGPEVLPGTSPSTHLLPQAQAQAQTPTLAHAQTQVQVQTPWKAQTDAQTPSWEQEQASVPPPRATRFPARFGITDEILEEAERGNSAATPSRTDPSGPSSSSRDMQSEAGSAHAAPSGEASPENFRREVNSEAQLASHAGPSAPQPPGGASATAVGLASNIRGRMAQLPWDAGLGPDASEPSSGRITPGAADVSRALRTTEGAVLPLNPQEAHTEQGSEAHVPEHKSGSQLQAGGSTTLGDPITAESITASLGSRTRPVNNRILHLDTSLGAVRQPPGNAPDDRTSLAPRLASLLREIKRRPGGAPTAPVGRPNLSAQHGGPAGASAQPDSGAAQPRQERGSPSSPADSGGITDVVGAFSIMGLQDFSADSAFLVTQCSVTSLKRRARQTPGAPTPARGSKDGRGGGKQAAKGGGGTPGAAGESKEMTLALASAQAGASSDESSAEATLRRLFGAVPGSKQRPGGARSGQGTASRRRVLLPRQPLHTLSGAHLRHPFMMSSPPGSSWPVGLFSPPPRAPPRLDPALNGRTGEGAVSRMARSNLLALADAYLTKQTAVIQPLTELLRGMATPHGTSTERLVHYTLAALEARFKGQPLGPLFASMTLSSQADVEASQYETGWKVFEEIVNTYTLVDALKGPSRVHILLINDMGGVCWSTLFQGLADQAGGAPAVRVTVLKLFLLGAAEGDEEGGSDSGPERGLRGRVAEAAARAGVPLSYRLVCAQPSQLHPGMVSSDPQEAVAVLSCWALAIFPDAQVLPSNPRNSMLKWIQSLSPRVFLLSEIDSDFNGGPFPQRLREFLSKVGAGFEFMGNTMPLASPARKALELSFVGSLVDAIAFEGLARVNRTERCEMWVDRLMSLGFVQHPLPQKAWDALQDLSSINKSFHVSNEGGIARFHLCGVPNFFCSAWSC